MFRKLKIAASLLIVGILAPAPPAKATPPAVQAFPLYTTYFNAANGGTIGVQNSPTNPLVTTPGGTTFLKLDPRAGGVGTIWINEYSTNGNLAGAGASGGPATNTIVFNTSPDLKQWTTTNAALSVTGTNLTGQTNILQLNFSNLQGAAGISFDAVTGIASNTVNINSITLSQPLP